MTINNDNLTATPAPAPAPAPAPRPRLAYTIRETAQMLGISYISVYRLVQRNKLRTNTSLRHRLIPRTEIERFLNEPGD